MSRKRPKGPAEGAPPTPPPPHAVTTPAKIRAIVLVLGVLLVASASWWWMTSRARSVDGAPGDGTSGIALVSAPLPAVAAAPASSDFAGAASCQSCHATQYAAWRASTHGNAGGTPGGVNGVRVIAPFDGTPLRFRDATVIPRQERGVFSFVVQRAGEVDTALIVHAVIGGGHMEGGGTQGFVTKWSDGTLRFLPFDWSKHSRTWFCNTGTRTNKGWLPVSASMRLADCGDWPPTRVLGDEPRFSNCQSCHGSQIDLAFDSSAKRWVSSDNGFAINCESCHGPAARHVARMQSGGVPSADIGLAALGTFDKEQSLTTCMGCHALKARLATHWKPGAELAQHYAVRLAQLGDQPLTADGRTRTFAYQEGHYASDCYRNGGMTCVSCHDPHSQGYRTVTGQPIPGRTDDRQCTSCHASKKDDLPAHTKHPVASTGSRCVSCHMPYQQEHELGRAIRYERSDHSIAIPRPALDSSLGIVSACRSCHAGVSEAQHAKQVTMWWGEIKPHEQAVAGVLSAREAVDIESATSKLLQADSRNVSAQVAGIAQWLDRFGAPDMPNVPSSFEASLRTMAASTDLDLRALSLATLHYVRGNHADTRRFLRQSISRDALRRRWVVVLGGIGDDARTKGDGARAVIAYRKALEVAPGDAALLLNLGLAYAANGDVARAVTSYRQSISADAQQPVAQVNLGVSLERAGDLPGAGAAYRQAIALDPTSPLGYFNLGTSLLREGNARDAIPMFERALARDPGLALGHFQLSLALLKQGDLVRAEASVRRALALDSSNADAAKLAQALREARQAR
mgnify:CR=1 FL=1